MNLSTIFNWLLNALYGAALVLPCALIGAAFFGGIAALVGVIAGHWLIAGIVGAGVGAVLVGGFALYFILNFAGPQ